MKIPLEAEWCRVEVLAQELERLEPDQVAARLAELAEAGESRSVLTLLGVWHRLPPPLVGLGEGSVVGGSYTLREKIGEGGMGAVWRATQKTIERDVALKIIHPSLVSPTLRKRAEDEIRVLGQLNHPGIVRIFAAGFHEDPRHGTIPYFAMELVEGVSLNRWAREHRGDRRRILEAVSALCESVQAAHDRRIVHRDLKPANIMVRGDGRPVVLDFGISRLVGMAEADEPHIFSGTPQYAAPEQHLGRDLDFRSGESVDVYALGAILFEVLSGRRLFEFQPGTTITEMRRAVLEDPVPRLASVLSECPPELDEVVTRAVRRDPADRYYSVSALGRAIARVAAAHSAPAIPPKRWEPGEGVVVPGTCWRLVKRLGEGGAGEVWLGSHEQLPDHLVFKFCSTEERARTLKREFTLFRLLKERIGLNPHFIRLHEVSLDEHPWYLMMDYENASDLESWCSARPGGTEAIPLEIRIEIVAQAAEALQAAHEAGILHRDIKPSNLLLRNRDNSPLEASDVHVLVADFGIGQIILDRLHVGDTRLGFTHTVSNLLRSEMSGTMLYLAPEVLEGSAATARSDIYSLGVVLWQLLMGNLKAALDPVDWTSRIADPLLRDDLHRCLAGSPNKRWASAGEFAASLRDLGSRQTAEARRRADLAARERAGYKRGMVLASLVATGVLALLAALGIYAYRNGRQVSLERSKSRSEQLRSHFSALGRLALSSAPNRHLTALTNVRQAPLETDLERHELADAYVAVLEKDDWLVDSAHPVSPGNPVECLTAVLDPTSRYLVRHLRGSVIDLVDTAECRVLWRQFFPLDDAAILAVAADGARAAVASQNHLRILDGSGILDRALSLPGPALALAWSPSGTQLAVGLSPDESFGEIELRNGPDWNVSARLRQEDGTPKSRPPAGLAYSPDGRWLAHWSLDSLHLLAWDVAQRSIAAYAYHPAPVRIAIWASARQLFSAAENAYLYRWDVSSGWGNAMPMEHPLARYPAQAAQVSGHRSQWVQVVPPIADAYFAAVDESGETSCIDLSTGQIPIAVPFPHPVVALGVSGLGFVSHHRDGSFRHIQLMRSPVLSSVASLQLGPIEDFDVLADGSLIACSGMGGVVVFDRNQVEHPGPAVTAQSRGVRFLNRDHLIASSRFGDRLLRWAGSVLTDAATAPPEAFIAENVQNTPARLALDATSRRVLVARARGVVWTDLTQTNAFRVEFDCAEEATPVSAAIAPHGSRIAWTNVREEVWVAEEGSAKPRKLPWLAVRVSFLGDRFCSLSGSDRVRVVEVGTGSETPVEGLTMEAIAELVSDDRGVFAASARRIGGIELGYLEANDGLRWRPMVLLGLSESGAFSRLRFMHGGRRLGGIAANGRLHVWDVNQLLQILQEVKCLPRSEFVELTLSGVPKPGPSTP